MAHPYPPHDSRLPYTGRHHYFLTFCTDERRPLFAIESHVALVRTQILRAAAEKGFELTAYCFMPDHVHLITAGRDEAADVNAFIKLSKQYSGYYFKRETGVVLWQRYGFERVIREDAELALTIRYILANPVQAGLVDHPAHYAHIGSQRHTVEELLAISEYDRSSV
jgi:putative transposase